MTPWIQGPAIAITIFLSHFAVGALLYRAGMRRGIEAGKRLCELNHHNLTPRSRSTH